MAAVHCLEECVCVVDKRLEARRVVRAPVEKLTPERASLNVQAEKTEVVFDTVSACICELEVAAGTPGGGLGVVMQAARALKGGVGVDEDKANATEVWAHDMLDEMFEHRALVEGLNPTVGGERARDAGLVDTELIRVRSGNTVALLESEGTVSDGICDTGCNFTVETFYGALGPFAGGYFD